MSIDILRRKRRQKQLEKWVTWAMMAEAFFIALSPSLAIAALMAGLLLTVWKYRVTKGMQFRHYPYDLPLFLFVLIAGASVLVSPDKGFSFYNYTHLVGVYLLTYLFIGQNVTSVEQVKKIVLSLGASAVLVVLYGFYQYIFGVDISDMKWVDGEAFPELTKRVFSTWENPNILAGYLDAVICVLLGFFMKSNSRAQRIALALGMILGSACLAMTYARGACLAVALVFLLYGVFKDWRVLMACIAVGGFALLVDPALYDRLASVFTKMDTSAEMRLAFWEVTVAMIQDHPFLGIGWGAYWMVYPEYDFYMQGEYIKIVHAHNIYLNYMAEIGIAGAMAFFWYFFGTMAMCFRTEILPKPEEPEPIGPVLDEEERERFFTLIRGGKPDPASEEPKEKKEEEEKEDASETTEEKPKPEGAEESPKKEEQEEKTAETSAEEPVAKEEEKAPEGDSEKESAEKEAETEESKEKSKEDVKEAPEEKEGEGEDSSKKESTKDESPKEETTKEASLKEETAKEETPKEESPKEEATKEESSKEESQVISLGDARAKKAEKASAEPEKEVEKEEKTDEKEDTAVLLHGYVEQEEEPEPRKTFSEYCQELKIWEDLHLRAGLSLGIGLAFASVALNGITDDLLFNIPTSMLLWFLAALAAVNVSVEEKK